MKFFSSNKKMKFNSFFKAKYLSKDLRKYTTKIGYDEKNKAKISKIGFQFFFFFLHHKNKSYKIFKQQYFFKMP